MENFLMGSVVVLIFLAPVFVLPPVMDFLLGDRSLRAMARRLFRIDAGATVMNVPDLPRRDNSR
jgi:hypothetical protein